MQDSIEYQSVIMRCDKIYDNAFFDASPTINYRNDEVFYGILL